MTELGRARAVIVIWTDASIKSDWVRSEAGRAQADRKLIPVKLEHLGYKDLPPPFDVLHTENIGEEDKIRAAVVAQLAKPAVEPSGWALLAKGFKYEVLSWFGIVGGALTLFTAIAAALVLAPWAQFLVDRWKKWTHAFWLWAFGWLGIHLPLEWTPVLSFLLFGSLLTIGQAFQFNRLIKTKLSIRHKYESYQSKAFPFIFSPSNPIVRRLKWRPLKRSWFLIAMVIMGIIAASWDYAGHFIGFAINRLPFAISDKWLSYLNHYSVALLILLEVLYSANHKLYAAVAVCLIVIFWTIILNELIAQPYSKGFLEFTAIALISGLSVILLSVAPAKAVSRRLIFLALGLLLLIALNELPSLALI